MIVSMAYAILEGSMYCRLLHEKASVQLVAYQEALWSCVKCCGTLSLSSLNKHRSLHFFPWNGTMWAVHRLGLLVLVCVSHNAQHVVLRGSLNRPLFSELVRGFCQHGILPVILVGTTGQ
eukprot:scaffold1997_cov318-Pavlova_lutheri.AAC.11